MTSWAGARVYDSLFTATSVCNNNNAAPPHHQYILLAIPVGYPFYNGTLGELDSRVLCKRLFDWRFGLVVTALGVSTKLLYVVPGWYWGGWSFCAYTVLVFNQAIQARLFWPGWLIGPAQPGHPSVGRRNEYYWRRLPGKRWWVLRRNSRLYSCYQDSWYNDIVC